ncbi:MAG: hypothetical protein GXO62_02765 [Epsilonproteobacteria bacterium]|nr:hypothetical protein [Campylobacterota bacterium]
MKKFILLLLVTFAFAFKDSDMDGVPDDIDKCPNTPFLALVNRYGCEIKKLKPSFLFYTGYEKDYIDSKKYSSYFFGFSVYFNKLLVGGYLSKYKIKNFRENTKNIFVGIKHLNLKTKIKLYFPTYYNDTHYLSYYLKYTKGIAVSFEHKTKDLKYNDTLTFSKRYILGNWCLTPYDYIYTNKNHNFLGLYISYDLTKSTSISLDISTGTNNNIEDYYVLSALSFFF